MEYVLTSHALKQLQKLPREIQIRIIKKLDFFCQQEDPFDYVEPLIRSELGTYRFRVGDYRIICDLENGAFLILLVGHRRHIYR